MPVISMPLTPEEEDMTVAVILEALGDLFLGRPVDLRGPQPPYLAVAAVETWIYCLSDWEADTNEVHRFIRARIEKLRAVESEDRKSS
jgi:hypothetical protein